MSSAVRFVVNLLAAAVLGVVMGVSIAALSVVLSRSLSVGGDVLGMFIGGVVAYLPVARRLPPRYIPIVALVYLPLMFGLMFWVIFETVGHVYGAWL